MEYLYEAVVHQKDLPFKIFTHTLEQYPYHWHEDTELLLILKGGCEMRVGNEHVILNEEDLFVINKNEVHYTKSTKADDSTQILVLQFDLSHYADLIKSSKSPQFKIPSAVEQKDIQIQNIIKTLMSKIMFSVLEHESNYRINVEIEMLKLIALLSEYYLLPDGDEGHIANQNDQRLLSILKYIDAHYMESSLSLNEISDAFYMNPQYLSRYFKTQIGLSLKKFIDNMRLNKSLMALQLTDERIIDIALKYGFPDAKAYYRVFKEVIGGTPQGYRESHKVDDDIVQPMDYFNINSRETFNKLNDYLSIQGEVGEVEIITSEVIAIDLLTLDTNHGESSNGKTLKNNASRVNVATKLLTFGYAGHGLRAAFETQLAQIQEEIGFDYVRFHGIFSDELIICKRTSDGKVTFDFSKVDQIIDLLLKYNIRPFLELGFMPSALASEERSLFIWQANISTPAYMKEWELLIDSFIRHLFNRYGKDEVIKWYFEFWNEPEIAGVFWLKSNEAFFEFYKTTYRTIKAINPCLRVGGFGNLFFEVSQGWLEKFERYAKENDILIDFYTFHIYNFKVENINVIDGIIEGLKDQFDHIDIEKLSLKHKLSLGDSENIQKSIENIVEKAQTLPFSEPSNKEIWITEWNTNTNDRELIRDTCFTAAFIVKTIFENDHAVNGMGYWTFTDIFEELSTPDSLFHGGFGLMTLNGLKKPSYHAFKFLKELGSTIVYSQENLRMTMNGDTYQLLAHNYCHYNDLYASMDVSKVTQFKRDSVFVKTTDKLMKIRINGLTGKYKIERQFVNSENGSVFDSWIKIGAPESLTKNAFDKLEAASAPGYHYQEINFREDTVIEMHLKPHEIQLLKITPIY